MKTILLILLLLSTPLAHADGDGQMCAHEDYLDRQEGATFHRQQEVKVLIAKMPTLINAVTALREVVHQSPKLDILNVDRLLTKADFEAAVSKVSQQNGFTSAVAGFLRAISDLEKTSKKLDNDFAPYYTGLDALTYFLRNPSLVTFASIETATADFESDLSEIANEQTPIRQRSGRCAIFNQIQAITRGQIYHESDSGTSLARDLMNLSNYLTSLAGTKSPLHDVQQTLIAARVVPTSAWQKTVTADDIQQVSETLRSFSTTGVSSIQRFAYVLDRALEPVVRDLPVRANTFPRRSIARKLSLILSIGSIRDVLQLELEIAAIAKAADRLNPSDQQIGHRDALNIYPRFPPETDLYDIFGEHK